MMALPQSMRVTSSSVCSRAASSWSIHISCNSARASLVLFAKIGRRGGGGGTANKYKKMQLVWKEQCF